MRNTVAYWYLLECVRIWSRVVPHIDENIWREECIVDYAVLKKVVEYGDVYELAAEGMTSVEELKTALKKNGATGGTLQRRMDFLTGEPAYIMVDGDHIKYDYQALAAELLGVMKSLMPPN